MSNTIASQEKPNPTVSDHVVDECWDGVKAFFKKRNIKTLPMRIMPISGYPGEITVSALGNHCDDIPTWVLNDVWIYSVITGAFPQRLIDHPGETEWVLDCETLEISPNKDTSIMENLDKQCDTPIGSDVVSPSNPDSDSPPLTYEMRAKNLLWGVVTGVAMAFPIAIHLGIKLGSYKRSK